MRTRGGYNHTEEAHDGVANTIDFRVQISHTLYILPFLPLADGEPAAGAGLEGDGDAAIGGYEDGLGGDGILGGGVVGGLG